MYDLLKMYFHLSMHTYILRVWINGIQSQESRYHVSGITVPENWNGGAIWAGFFNTTERPEDVDAGNFRLVGTDEKEICESFTELLKYPEDYGKWQGLQYWCHD